MSLAEDGTEGNLRFSLALVTGATSGIGLAVARLLAKQGINLIVHGRDKARLDEVCRELQAQVNVQLLQADLAIPEDLNKVATVIAQQQPDLLINNAGYGLYGDALDYPTAQQMEILQVDGYAPIKLTLECARTLIANGRTGCILNVSSVAAFFVFPGFSLYSASKALLNQFSESFDCETSTYGVRILASCPGVVASKFRANALKRGGMAETSKNSTSDEMTNEFAAEEIWKQILKNQKLRVFNWRYRLARFLSLYVLPKSLTAKILGRSIKNIKSK